MQSIPKMDELKISWNDSIRKLIHKKCHQKIYHNDIKNHMTLNIISIVVRPIPWTAIVKPLESIAGEKA